MLGAFIYSCVSFWISHYTIPLLASCNSFLFFQFILSDMSIVTSSFILTSICMKYLPLPSPFHSVYNYRSKRGLLLTAYIQVFFQSHSASLCLLAEERNPFKFKAIFNMYVLTAILVIVLDLFLQLFFTPFIFCSLLL